LIELVEAGCRRFHEAARAIPIAALDRPLDDDWTPRQAVRHMVARAMHRAREVLYVALSGEVPGPEEPALPDDIEALLATHREAIDSLYEHVRQAGDDFLAVQWAHPAFGEMNWHEWMAFIQVHTEDHTQQLEKMAGAA
jgi:hypothetical protein